MIALIAGTGDLPGLLARRLTEAGTPPVICALAGFAPDLPPDLARALPRVDFRLEGFGTLLAGLRGRGVTRICLAGLVRRPVIDPALVDAATAPLIPALARAMRHGDDGALRALIALIEAQGFAVTGAAAIAPDLVARPAIPTRRTPGDDARRAMPVALARIAAMGRADSGQACVIRAGRVIAEEGPEGTDALLCGLPPGQGGFLWKAPKPGQELRADMPVIGPETARGAARAGLDGIAIAAGGVLVLDAAGTVAQLDADGLWLWSRAPDDPAGAGA
ncbi:MAG: UDP-2,3-diacylglucosamine diphosphatase LpxI [Rubellimicrobium sp.]|nr:UDP-2,3-diacylglucosamine diphosphatase LpxI [Rubellimicrobium sp.]